MATAYQLATEYPPPNEAKSIEDLWNLQLKLMKLSPQGTSVRGQHAKGHGCVGATFRISDDLPDWAAVGIFQRGSSYDAIVRFSNGFSPDDRNPDVHGLAIKLFDVPGKKLAPTEPDAGTLDLILADHPTFFVPDVQMLFEFMSTKTELTVEGLHPEEVMKRLTEKYPDIVPKFLAFVRQKPTSVFDNQYNSIGPYLLGECRAVKYVLRPGPNAKKSSFTPSQDDKDFLSQELASRLSAGAPQEFEFYLQEQVDADQQPIEDASVEWRSPMTKVGTLTVPPQNVQTSADKCKNLSFNPWRTLDVHRPLGGLNRSRKAIYEKSSALRHETNQVPMKEPTSAN